MAKLPLFVQPQAPQNPQYPVDTDPTGSNDSWLIKATEALKGAAGFPDTTTSSRVGELASAAVPFGAAALKGLGVAAPLISIFKDAEGVPSAALRQAGTENFLNKAAYWPDEMQNAASEFAQRYPRVAAHIKPSYGEIPEKPGALAAARPPWGQVKEPVEVTLSPRGAEHMEAGTLYKPEVQAGLQRGRNIMYHEGTHVAQALGNKDFAPLYQAANDAVGYDLNPFEGTASRAGARAKGAPITKGSVNAIDQLKNLAAVPSHNTPEQTIAAILGRRSK